LNVSTGSVRCVERGLVFEIFLLRAAIESRYRGNMYKLLHADALTL
jgi:hypothetical protein